MGPEQTDLPGFGDLPRFEPPQASRQPSPEYGRPVTNHDILYRHLDLHARGRFHNWLEEAQSAHGFDLKDILPEVELTRVRLYLYPQPGGHWLNQSEVAGELHPSEFRHTIVRAMVRVRRREMFGPRAIEVLKPGRLFYSSCLKAGINTLDDLFSLLPEQLRILCAMRSTYGWLVSAIYPFQPDWVAPEIHFRDELPPEEAYYA